MAQEEKWGSKSMLNAASLSASNHGTLRVPWFTAFVSVLALWLYAAGGGLFSFLIFDKQAIWNGEVWRLLTGHFVHSNSEHFFWDLLAFGILGSIIELNAPKQFGPSLLFSCLAVSGWLLFGNSNVSTYCGLSGALNGLLVVAVFYKSKESRSVIYGGVLLGTLSKIIYELFTRTTVFTNLSLQAVPEAHLAGFVAGIMYVMAEEFWVRSR